MRSAVTIKILETVSNFLFLFRDSGQVRHSPAHTNTKVPILEILSKPFFSSSDHVCSAFSANSALNAHEIEKTLTILGISPIIPLTSVQK